MSIFSRNKKPSLEGAQVFSAAPEQPRKKLLRNVAAVIIVIVVIIVAGLLLGRLLSKSDDNSNQDDKTQSQQRVNQSPQNSGLPETPEPSDALDSGAINQ